MPGSYTQRPGLLQGFRKVFLPVKPQSGEGDPVRQPEGADDASGRDGEGRAACRPFRELEGLGRRSFQQGFPGGIIRPDILQRERRARVAFRGRKSKDTDVLVVAPVLIGRLALGQADRYVAFLFHVGAGPDEHPHRVFGLDPRPAGHRPPRAGLQGEAQAEAVGFLAEVSHQFFPFGREGADLMVRFGPGTAEMAVEPLDTGKTGAGDGFQVGVDTFLGNVAADEVKPGLWVEDLVRLEESGLVRGGEGGGQYGRIGGDVHRLSPQGGCGAGQECKRGQGRQKGTVVFHINIVY